MLKINDLQKSKQWLSDADAILIGASNGLSIAEGYHIFANNKMFRSQFSDFQAKYGVRNIVESCFYPYPNEAEKERFFQRLIQFWIDDYQPSQVMVDLIDLVKDTDYFVLTSNGDRHLQLSGFDDAKIFEIEGNFYTKFQHFEDKTADFHQFIEKYKTKNLVILELGIGIRNTLIKRPLMQLAHQIETAKYITLNLASELYIPQEIAEKSIGLAGDIALTLRELKR